MLKKSVEKKWQCASLSVMSASGGSGSLPNFARDRVRELLGRRLSAEIGRARFPGRDDAFDGAEDPIVQVPAAEMVEHEGARPDRADWVGDPCAGDVGRRAMNRLEHRRKLPLRIDVGAGRDSKAS